MNFFQRLRRPRPAPTSLAARAASFGLVTLTFAACAPTQVSRETTSLRVRGAQEDALVTVDDEYVGTLGEVQRRGVALPPGQHRVTVEKPGYFPWDRLVQADGPPVQLQVTLTRIPD